MITNYIFLEQLFINSKVEKKFSKPRNQDLGEIFAFSRNPNSKRDDFLKDVQKDNK